MEFNEKLQTLRKAKGLTQEDLAEILFVSRTAVSKWESGRGYPSIDSLKDISEFFSVSIDDLLSGDKIISIAEKENKSNMRRLCESLFGILDLFSVMLIFLPLYPETINGFIYSVNFLQYKESPFYNIVVYWILFVSLFISGIVKVVTTKTGNEKYNKILTKASVAINILAVLYLMVTRQVYAVIILFVLLITKLFILSKEQSSTLFNR